MSGIESADDHSMTSGAGVSPIKRISGSYIPSAEMGGMAKVPFVTARTRKRYVAASEIRSAKSSRRSFLMSLRNRLASSPYYEIGRASCRERV